MNVRVRFWYGLLSLLAGTFDSEFPQEKRSRGLKKSLSVEDNFQLILLNE